VRVLVTGGTGYVGSYAVQALLAAGHQPRLLIRNRDRLALTVAAIGVDTDRLELVDGDTTDEDSVRRALDGVDAVIHCAAVVAALNRADAQRTVSTNVDGARIVIESALHAGCDPVVHISSVAALYTPAAPMITSDLPPAVTAASPYTRSKALAEELARSKQAEGCPVTIVYPGGVSGPCAGDVFGDVAEGFVSMLKSGLIPLKDGGFGVIDVRDLAAVLVATLTSGQGPRRYIAGGELLDMNDIARLLRSVTGRRIPVLPTPGMVFRGVGRITDRVRNVVPFDTVFTAEAMDLLTRARPTDDAGVHDELGITYRPPIETVEAMVHGLYAAGRLSAKQVGPAAAAT
jgi:nucleoside-diphosphate-sugar epimerase